MKLKKMNKEERSLLLFLETCAVDQGGRVDMRCMNSEDVALAATWNESGFVEFGRIQASDIFQSFTHWCQLSEEAWELLRVLRHAKYVIEAILKGTNDVKGTDDDRLDEGFQNRIRRHRCWHESI